MKRLVAGLLAVVCAGSGLQASAADITRPTLGQTFYHRAGADLAAQDQAIDFCLQQTATTAHALRGPMKGVPMGVLDQLVEAQINKSRDVRVEDRGFAVNFENCMVATGWSIMRLPDAEGAALAALPTSELRQQLAGMVGAETPRGQLARRFLNDILSPATRWLVEPGEYDKLPLPLVARNGGDWRAVRLAAKPPPPPPLSVPNSAAPAGIAAIPANQWNSLPEGTTAVLFTVARVQDRIDEPIIIMMREGPDPRAPAWHHDGQIDLFTAGMGFNKKVRPGGLIETTYMLPVPPGRWRLSGVKSGRVVTSFCLGAPSVIVEKGQVTWLGRFAYGETPQLAPDVTMATAARMTSGAPDLYKRLKPGQWDNGTTFDCDGAFIYAFEAPGAPRRASAPPPPSSPAPAPASAQPEGARP